MSRNNQRQLYMSKQSIWKLLFAIMYNTNTMVVNPTIYLKFLIPFLILGDIFTWKVALMYILSLFIYNIAYIINDYIDYTSDIMKKRQKRSFVYLYEKNFITPLVCTFIIISLGIIMVGYQVLLPIIVMIIITTVLAFLHSKFYNLKPVTILLLRFLRISLPPLLLLPIEPNFRNLLLFSLAVFPIYNIKSYVGYMNTKGFNDSKPGIVMSIVTSGISIYLCQNNIKELALYILLFSLISTVVKVTVNKAPEFIVRPLKKILEGLGYKEVEEKAKELITFFLYLLLLGIVIWF